jgi:hypothetical protein
MNGFGILLDNLLHSHNLCLEVLNIMRVSLNSLICLIILLSKYILLRGNGLQPGRQLFRLRLQGLPLLDQLLQLQRILQQLILSDVLLPLQLLLLLPQSIEPLDFLLAAELLVLEGFLGLLLAFLEGLLHLLGGLALLHGLLVLFLEAAGLAP